MQTNREEWQTTGTTGFQGNISHHGAGKPFKDGFVNKAGVAAAAKADAEQEVSNRSVDVPILVSEHAWRGLRYPWSHALVQRYGV